MLESWSPSRDGKRREGRHKLVLKNPRGFNSKAIGNEWSNQESYKLHTWLYIFLMWDKSQHAPSCVYYVSQRCGLMMGDSKHVWAELPTRDEIACVLWYHLKNQWGSNSKPIANEWSNPRSYKLHTWFCIFSMWTNLNTNSSMIKIEICTMKTTLRIGDKRNAWTNCSTISPDDRWFLNPMLPVAQNLQPILQPTYNKAQELQKP